MGNLSDRAFRVGDEVVISPVHPVYACWVGVVATRTKSGGVYKYKVHLPKGEGDVPFYHDMLILHSAAVERERANWRPAQPPAEQKSHKDITDQLEAKLVKSQHSDGYYVSLMYEGKSIIALGIDDKSAHILRAPAYRVKKADGATVSFRVTKWG